MPSGGHGGGGGSHFSGGSHSFSSHGYSSGYHPIRPMIIGRHYYMGVGAVRTFNNILTFIVFTLFGLAIALMVVLGSYDDRNQIVSDHDRYIDMIEYAKEHPDYQRVGYVTDTVYNDELGRYYYTYKIQRDDNPSLWLDDGFSYALYTFYTIKDINVGDSVVFAIDSNYVTANTDSINMDYENFSLEDDKEYSSANNSMMIAGIVSGLCLVGTIGLFVYSLSFKNKNKKEIIHNSNIEEGYKACPYCGASVKTDAKKCDNCGVEY